ncbi:MAG: carbohydrate ABC transporter permease [Clostridium sp.]|nr:carbohydrate ABC transporter permease [Clostridium sp.]
MKRAFIIIGYTLIVLGAVSMIAPFLWMLSVSFMTNSQIFSYPPQILPNPIILNNYQDVFTRLPITRFFINSLFVAATTTIFQVLFSSMAGFAFARSKFEHKDFIFFIFLLTMMIPPQVNIIPLFFLMRELHWIDTYQALILPGIFGGFGVFLMRQWFKGLSSEIEDAAKIDGCNFFEIFFKIALPLSTPAAVTLALFTFITAWNSFMWPLIVTNSEAVTTLPVAVSQFRGSFREIIMWGDLCACSVILSIPVILIFLAGKKYFINDMLAGGIKE